MKRKCSGCKAFGSPSPSHGRCLLGYKIEPVRAGFYGLIVSYRPVEECPKPKTNKEFVVCVNEQLGRISNNGSTDNKGTN